MSFVCPKCGSNMQKMYSNDEAKEIVRKSGLKGILATKYEFELLKQFVCTNQKECSYVKQLSTSEIIKGFIDMKRGEGKSNNDIIDEAKKGMEESLKELKKDNIIEEKELRFGIFIVTDLDKYKWYWMGKSPKVRKGVETYMERFRDVWNTNYFETQKYIAREYGISYTSIGKHFRILKDRKLIKELKK